MKIKKGNWIITGILLLLVIFCETSCSKKINVDEEASPRLADVEISSYNEGTEKSQYVEVNLIFDREISVSSEAENSLRITVAGERVKEEEYTLTAGDDLNSARLLLSVEAITDGILKIGKAETADAITDIRNADGTCAAEEFTVEGSIPSGVTLSTVEAEPGRVTKQVDTYWNIRSIAWVGLWEDGVLAPASETRPLEMLDGYAAVHGHEFLMEDEKDIAEKICEVLTDNYSEEYRFSCEGAQVSAEKDGAGTLDIVIYEYLVIDGNPVKTPAAENGSFEESGEAESAGLSEGTAGEDSHSEEHEADVKTKMLEADRTVSETEQAFLNRLHLAEIVPGQITDGKDLYRTMIITGEAMPEEQIYSVRDLEELLQASFENQNMYALELPAEYGGYVGLDLKKFLPLCGADLEAGDVTLYLESEDGTAKSYLWQEIGEDALLFLALGGETGGLGGEDEPVSGPIAFGMIRGESEEWLGNLSQIRIGFGDEPEDPEYRYHNREPFLEGAKQTFTLEVYQKGAEYLGAVKTITWTTTDLEALMQENPEAVVRNYYGTIGDEATFPYMGVGGWLDCFEGLDLKWLLTKQAGLTELSGRAELVGRDGEVYTTIEDLNYLDFPGAEEEYYTLSADGVRIPCAVPMIACVKNSYPILPEHEHESEAYIAYNQLNLRLEQEGIVLENGVVKNHNGPFIACLGNRDGYYGGNQIETGGDCVCLRLYLD